MEGSVSAYGDTCKNILEKLPVEYSSMIQDMKIGEKKIYFYGDDNLRGKIEYKKDATGMGTFLDIHQGVLKISWHFDGLSDGKFDYILVYYGDDVKTWQ